MSRLHYILLSSVVGVCNKIEVSKTANYTHWCTSAMVAGKAQGVVRGSSAYSTNETHGDDSFQDVDGIIPKDFGISPRTQPNKAPNTTSLANGNKSNLFCDIFAYSGSSPRHHVFYCPMLEINIIWNQKIPM